MEDLIGLLIFLGFAAFSVIGNLAKKKQTSTDPVGENAGNGRTSLKDILASLQEELLGKSEIPEEQKPKVRKKNVHKEEVLPVEEIRSVRSIPAVNESSFKSASRNTPIALTKEQLRQAMIWKEILDPPVSLR